MPLRTDTPNSRRFSVSHIASKAKPEKTTKLSAKGATEPLKAWPTNQASTAETAVVEKPINEDAVPAMVPSGSIAMALKLGKIQLKKNIVPAISRHSEISAGCPRSDQIASIVDPAKNISRALCEDLRNPKRLTICVLL